MVVIIMNMSMSTIIQLYLQVSSKVSVFLHKFLLPLITWRGYWVEIHEEKHILRALEVEISIKKGIVMIWKHYHHCSPHLLPYPKQAEKVLWNWNLCENWECPRHILSWLPRFLPYRRGSKGNKAVLVYLDRSLTS